MAVPSPTETFRRASSGFGDESKWQVARLRQALPSSVERTGLAELSLLLDQHGLSEHKEAISKAYKVAEAAHAGVTRQEGSPYIHHPARVCAMLIKEADVKDPDILCAALLHDVVEDTPMTVADIKAQFGVRTSDFVEWLTKPDSSKFPSKEACNRYQAERLSRAPREVRLVKVADRLDNVGDLHLLPNNGKMEKYLRDTRENYLPLAQATSEVLFRKLDTRVAQLERLAQLQQAA